MRLRGLATTFLARLVASALAVGCQRQSAESEIQPLSALPAPREAPRTPPAVVPDGRPLLSFQVDAPYPASVLYALDAAASFRREEPRYRRWLFGQRPPPAWLEPYAARRHGWAKSIKLGDGWVEPYLACSYRSASMDALLGCASQVLEASDFELARVALRETEALLRPRWRQLEPALAQRKLDLEALVSGAVGEELVQILARAAQLSAGKQLVFRVVLVANPGGQGAAYEQGPYLVTEVGNEAGAPFEMPTFFHELAHFAASQASQRLALQRAFVGRGRAGVVAANLWGEAFATAFGALAEQRLDPSFRLEEPMYGDNPAIDALGRALFVRWRAGTPLTLDASLADEMLQAMAAAWPPERWRFSDLFMRACLFADSTEAAVALRRSLRPREVLVHAPLPAELGTPEGFPPPMARVFAVSLETLYGRLDLLERFRLDAPVVRERLAAHGPSAYWLEDVGEPEVLLSAATQQELVLAASRFGALTQLPEPGWISLGDVKPRAKAKSR